MGRDVADGQKQRKKMVNWNGDTNTGSIAEFGVNQKDIVHHIACIVKISMS